MKASRFLMALSLASFSSCVLAQTTPDMATGLSPYATYIPSEIDNVNPANGNIFIKIPLLGYPQKGEKLRMNYYIFYNDKQWQANLTYNTPSSGNPYISGAWTPSGVSLSGGNSLAPSPIGVYVARDQYLGFGANYNQTKVQTFGTGSDEVIESTSYLTQYVYTTDGAIPYVGDGVKETVGCGPLVPSNSCPDVPSWGNGLFINTYPATDGSGYDQHNHDPKGNIYTGSSVTDPNGNSVTWSSSGWTDTMGRFIPGGNTGPGANEFPNASGYTVSSGFFDLVPGTTLSGVPSQCPSGTSAARSWTVPGSTSNGGSATYYLCYSYLTFQTAFNLGGNLMTESGIAVDSPPDVNSSSGLGEALLLTAVVLPDLN